MAWEAPLLKYKRVREVEHVSFIKAEDDVHKFIREEILSDFRAGNRVIEYSFDLVYKWFGLRENGRLNLCNPIHIGALAIAREIVKCTSDFMRVKRPARLQELADMIVNQARKSLLLHCNDDLDYRRPRHFYAVSVAAHEILNLRE